MAEAEPLVEPELPDGSDPGAVPAAALDEVLQMDPKAKKGMTRRILGGTLHYGMGQALPQVLRFLLLPVFTLVLTQDDYGVLELATLFSTFLLVFMRMGVPGAVMRFYYDHHEGPELSDYVTTIAMFLMTSSLAIGLATILIGPWLFAHLIPGLAFYPFGLLAVGTAVISCNQNLQDRLVQAREQSSYMAKLNIGRAAISIVVALIFVVGLRWGARGMLWADLIAAALIFVQAGRYLLPNLHGHFQPQMMRTSVKYGLGILPSHVIGTMAPLVTSSILADAINLGAVGELGVARKFTLPLTVLASAFQTAFIPIYFSLRKNHSAKNVDTLVRTARFVWAAAIFTSIGGIFFIPPILRLMTPERFHDAAVLVPILVIGFLSQTVYFVFAPELYYSKKTYLVPVVSAASAIVSIGVSVWTVKTYGAVGIAWANSLGVAAMAATAVLLTRRLVSVPHRGVDLLRLTSCGAAVAAAGWVFARGSTVQEMVVAVVAAAAYPAVLWICGDPTVREAAGFLSQRWSMFNAR